MENRKASRKVEHRNCDFCGKEFEGRSLFCSNECVEAFTEKYNKEYRAIQMQSKCLDAKEAVLKKCEKVFMYQIELEGKGIQTSVDKPVAN